MGKTLKTKRLGCYSVIVTGSVCVLMSQNILAAALFDHIVQPYIGTELTYDNNLLRLPSNFTPNLSGGKTTTSSFIKQLKAGISAKWQISRQQLLMDANINQNWYSSFNELDYTGYDISGRWKWQIYQKLKGELSYNNSKRLDSFAQINRLISNVREREEYIANGAYEILPDWYLRAGYTHVNTHYPALSRQQSNLIEGGKEFGLRYSNIFNNMVGFRMTITDGKYPNRIISTTLDNSYTRTSYDLEGIWNYSVKTQVIWQLGYVSQKYQHLTERDFTAVTASAGVRWDITAKSAALLSIWRRVSLNDSLVSTFIINSGVMLTPIWTWSESPKIKVSLPISYEQQIPSVSSSFNNTAVFTAPDKFKRSVIRLNLDYTPIQNIEMTAFVSYEQGHSTNSLHTYHDEIAGLTMKVSF